MQTYDQFRESERRTWPVRGAATALALGAAGLFSFGQLPVAEISFVPALYVAFFLVVRLVILDRCRSDRWIYGMLVAETGLAALAVAVFGLVSPAIVLPLMLVPHYAHVLGRNGAYTAAAAGLIAMSAALAFHPIPEAGLIAALAISPVMLAGIVAFTAESRFRERRAKEQALDWRDTESGSGRLLEAVLKMSSKRGDSEVAKALAEGLRIATGYPTAVTLLNRSHDNTFVPAAVSSVNGELKLDRITPESVDSDTAVTKAVRQGSAISFGHGGLSSDNLPEWALEFGYRSGISAPITRRMDVLGAIYILGNDLEAPGLKPIEHAEVLTSFASRLLSVGNVQAVAATPTALKEILTRAGRAATPDERSPIELPHMKLEPVSEKLVIEGVGVSLSRTEFSMLYALAKSAGSVVSPSDLIDMCWDDGSAPNANAVDVTIYRLRRKLAKTPAGKGIVRTVRGKGYMLAQPTLVDSQSTAA